MTDLEIAQIRLSVLSTLGFGESLAEVDKIVLYVLNGTVPNAATVPVVHELSGGGDGSGT